MPDDILQHTPLFSVIGKWSEWRYWRFELSALLNVMTIETCCVRWDRSPSILSRSVSFRLRDIPPEKKGVNFVVVLRLSGTLLVECYCLVTNWLAKLNLQCKVWDFDGGDYEECRLLGYKNPVRTSQETHYVNAADSSQLILCNIWGFDGGDYEEWRLLGCYAVWIL
jgi:hypothetical protein